jgi:hypothetical protein
MPNKDEGLFPMFSLITRAQVSTLSDTEVAVADAVGEVPGQGRT